MGPGRLCLVPAGPAHDADVGAQGPRGAHPLRRRAHVQRLRVDAGGARVRTARGARSARHADLTTVTSVHPQRIWPVRAMIQLLRPVSGGEPLSIVTMVAI